METATLLKLVYIFLGLTFIAVGVYIVLVLVELRENLRRTKNILERTDNLLNFLETKIVRPAAAATNYLGLIKEFVGLASSFKSALNRKSKREASDD